MWRSWLKLMEGGPTQVVKTYTAVHLPPTLSRPTHTSTEYHLTLTPAKIWAGVDGRWSAVEVLAEFLLFWVFFALLDPNPDSKSGSTDLIESGSYLEPGTDPKPCRNHGRSSMRPENHGHAPSDASPCFGGLGGGALGPSGPPSWLILFSSIRAVVSA